MSGADSSSSQIPHPHPPPRSRIRLRIAGGRLEKVGRWVLGGTHPSPLDLDHLTEQEQQFYTDHLRAAIESARRDRR